MGSKVFGNWVADSALQRPGAVWGLTYKFLEHAFVQGSFGLAAHVVFLLELQNSVVGSRGEGVRHKA